MHTARNKRSAAQQNAARYARVHTNPHVYIVALWISLDFPRVVAWSSAVPHSLGRSVVTMTSPYVLNDVFFKRALSSLPATLLEAMLFGGTQPAVHLRRAGDPERNPLCYFSKLGFFSPSFSPGMLLTVAAIASAAVLAAKAVPSVVSSLSSSSVCLSVSLADGHPASNAPDSSVLQFDSTFSTTGVVKEAADGHPALNAPVLSRVAAQTDSASKATLKKGVFQGDSARFQRISQITAGFRAEQTGRRSSQQACPRVGFTIPPR